MAHQVIEQSHPNDLRDAKEPWAELKKKKKVMPRVERRERAKQSGGLGFKQQLTVTFRFDHTPQAVL